MSFHFSLDAQTDIAGHEKYDSYKQSVILDNLNQKLIPEIFNDLYYSKLKNSELNVNSQTIDTTSQTRYMYVYTKKAKDGYLFINNSIMDKITESNYSLDELKLLYIYNNKTVSTEDEIDKILRLKKRKISDLDIVEENPKVISVYIKVHR